MARRDEVDQKSRRSFLKTGIAGGGVLAGSALMKGMPSVSAISPAQGYPEYGTYLVWFDTPNFKARNLKTGVPDEFVSTSAGAVINSIIGRASPPASGDEIWLADEVNDDLTTITISRDNISLIGMRKTGARYSNAPRPHLFKVQYAGAVRGGLLRGFHCREINFDGGGNQQQMALEDITMHVNAPPAGGLLFLGGTGYQQYINIHNLEIALSGTDPIGIQFGNTNNGSGHIDFSGHTIVACESDAAGTPEAIRFNTGVETGTPIRVDNVSIIDASARTAGNALRGIHLQPQSAVSKGVRQLNFGRLFFEQHYVGPHTIFTIDPSTGSAMAWFIATVDELCVTDDSGKVVNIVNNANTLWQTREQLLRINSGYKVGNGTLALGTPNQHNFFRVYLGKISPLTPFGKILTPFQNAASQFFCGAGGTSASPIASTDYVVGPTPVEITVATSFGPLTIKDPAGNIVKVANATSAAAVEYVPAGYLVQFGSTGGITVYGA